MAGWRCPEQEEGCLILYDAKNGKRLDQITNRFRNTLRLALLALQRSEGSFSSHCESQSSIETIAAQAMQFFA